MLTIYVKTGCPYSRRALEKLRDLKVPFEERNIADVKNAEELVRRGGKRQVPFLIDEDPCINARQHAPCLVDDDIELYDSRDIMEYLERRYGDEVRIS